MKPLSRIVLNPEVMGGKPCIRGLRVSVGAIVVPKVRDLIADYRVKIETE